MAANQSSHVRLGAALSAAALLLGACSGGGPAPSAAPATNAAASTQADNGFDPEVVKSIKIDDYPIIPAVPAGMRSHSRRCVASG